MCDEEKLITDAITLNTRRHEVCQWNLMSASQSVNLSVNLYSLWLQLSDKAEGNSC